MKPIFVSLAFALFLSAGIVMAQTFDEQPAAASKITQVETTSEVEASEVETTCPSETTSPTEESATDESAVAMSGCINEGASCSKVCPSGFYGEVVCFNGYPRCICVPE